jgi:hypothetical protein
MSRALAGFVEDLALQRGAVRERSPVQERLYQVLLELLPGDVGARLEAAWRERDFRIFYERPLLVLAALRDEALREGPAHPLHAALAAARPDPSAIDRASLTAALAPERAVWRSLEARFVQTNETTRALAWLWPAALVGPRPLAIVDVGASAGLNLVADALPNPWTTTADGTPLAVATRPEVVARVGLDARPLDVTDDESARWLEACVWPGETARLERLQAAIAAMRRAPVPLETLFVRHAPARIERLLEEHPGALVLAYQSLVRDYLEPEERELYERGMRSLPPRALWLELELQPDGATPTLPCALIAHAAGERLVLARCNYHPSGVAVDEAAANRLTSLSRSGALG